MLKIKIKLDVQSHISYSFKIYLFVKKKVTVVLVDKITFKYIYYLYQVFYLTQVIQILQKSPQGNVFSTLLK